MGSLDVDAFRIDVPSSWRELPTDQAALRAALKDLTESMPELGTVERRRVELYVRRFVQDLESVAARYAALWIEFPDTDAAEGPEAVVPLVAAVIVSVTDQASVGSPIPLTPSAVLAALSLAPEGDESVLASVRSTSLEHPEKVALPRAMSVRRRQLLEHHLTRSETISLATETYFVPVPDLYERMMIVQFSTPNLADASALTELFEAIAATVRFYREGEETTL